MTKDELAREFLNQLAESEKSLLQELSVIEEHLRSLRKGDVADQADVVYESARKVALLEALEQIRKAMLYFSAFNGTPKKRAEEGALVEVELKGSRAYFLLIPDLGTTCKLEIDGREYRTLSPSAPLYRAVAGKRAGEQIKVAEFEGRIVSVE